MQIKVSKEKQAEYRKNYKKNRTPEQKEKEAITRRKYRRSEKGKLTRQRAYKKQYTKNRERFLAYAKEKRSTKEYKESARYYYVKKTYGLSKEEYKKLYETYDYKCAICKQPETNESKRFVVDHCHSTNKVRGLLCNTCNLILGYAKDNIDILESAIKYLNIGKTI